MKLRVGSVCVLTALAIAAQATSAVAAAADDRRAEDRRYEDSRYGDRRDEDRRYEDRADRRYDDRRYDERRDDRYADDRYYDNRGGYPYGRPHYDEPQPERYCGVHKGRRAPAIMTYDQRTGTQVLVDNNAQGVAVTGRNDESGSAFAVRGDLSEPNVPYMCAADAQTGDAYVIDPDDSYDDATVRGIDADTGRRWEITNDGVGPEFETYDPYTGCVARAEPRESGRPVVVSGYDEDHRRFEDEFFAGSAVVLGAAAVGAAASGGGTAAAALGAGALGAAVAADGGRAC